MDDIEREIEGLEENEEEEKTITRKINGRKDGNKKKIIIIIIIVIAIILAIGTTIYLKTKNNQKNSATDNLNSEKETKKEETTSNDKNLAYVECDSNASLLNVRNSTTGDIIDGLSCFQELTIEEEEEKTDNCPKWYKISYQKRGGNYTGYVCSTYIKESTTSSSTKKIVGDLIDKANDYHKNSVLKAYCGNDLTGKTKEIEFENANNKMTGEYLKSEYKSLDELKKYLLSFLDEKLIDIKLELSDYNDRAYYDNYYEIDNSLYCRNYSGKDWNTMYTGNYNFEVTEDDGDEINARIAYEYLNKENEKCTLDNLSSCTTSQFKYEIGNIKIKKVEEDYIITSIDFYK